MPKSAFHSAIETAQHGGKKLQGCLDFAKGAHAQGIILSNYLLENDSGGFLKASEIKTRVSDKGLKLSAISAHCPFWVHTSLWTGTKTIRPFAPDEVKRVGLEKGEGWMENYLLRLLDLCAELEVKTVAMFWGHAFGLELAAGYPWGFFKGTGYDLVQEGRERFVKKTQRIRDHARKNNQKLCHEIHPGTAAQCADEFHELVEICDGDKCLGVIADPSHCWDGEDWETRFESVGDRIYLAHIKDFRTRTGRSLRSRHSDWTKRGMEFVKLGTGEVDMEAYAELLVKVGYPQRYCALTGSDSAPLGVEAESAVRDLDYTSTSGIKLVNENLLFPIAGASFEEGMGETKKKD